MLMNGHRGRGKPDSRARSASVVTLATGAGTKVFSTALAALTNCSSRVLGRTGLAGQTGDEWEARVHQGKGVPSTTPWGPGYECWPERECLRTRIRMKCLALPIVAAWQHKAKRHWQGSH